MPDEMAKPTPEKDIDSPFIYRLATRTEWDISRQSGIIERRPVDDAYYHLSGFDQVLATANKHFQDADTLLVLKFETACLADHLKWELAPSRGQLFPHYFGNLRATDVLETLEINNLDGTWHWAEKTH